MEDEYKVLHSVSEVIEKAKKFWRPSLVVEEVKVDSALRRYAARDYYVKEDVPPFTRSVVDGCATIHEMILTASPSSPAVLSIDRGDVVLVNTGDPIPEGYNVVVPIEYCEIRGGLVYVYEEFRPGYGVSIRGEDLRKGDLVVSKGRLLTSVDIGLLASMGIGRVEVYKPFKAIVYSTGDELVEPWEDKKSSAIYNSTGHLVSSFLREHGFETVYAGILSDNAELIESALERAIESSDIVVFTGGTSKGKRDVTARVLKRFLDREGGVYWHGFKLRPGRPLLFGVLDEKIVLGLSGFPVAAWSELYVVFLPVFLSKIGGVWPPYPVISGLLLRNLPSRPGFVEVYRVLVSESNGRMVVEPLRLTGSGVLSSLAKGNAVFITEENSSGYSANEMVFVHLLHSTTR